MTTPAERLLIEHWDNFTDCQPVPDDFLDMMEKAGLVEYRRVTRADLQQSGAEDRGIEKGGMCWSLTADGTRVFAAIA